MVYLEEWDTFQTQAQAMFTAAPTKVRLTATAERHTKAAGVARHPPSAGVVIANALCSLQTRLVVKYRHVDGKFTAKVTDDAQVSARCRRLIPVDRLTGPAW
jgi:hypothetical protein